MSGIAPLGPGTLSQADSYQYRSNGAAVSGEARTSHSERGADSIELSPTARRVLLLDRLLSDPPVRQELIDRVRQEIESGRYNLDSKIDRVVDEIWNDHFADDTTA